MAISKEKKNEIIKGITLETEVQIAVLTYEINHFKWPQKTSTKPWINEKKLVTVVTY